MKLGDRGLALIKEFEGFPHGGRPYRDMVGVWTIGYGHTKGVGPNTRPITIQQASDMLREEVDSSYAPSVASLGVGLQQNQFDAIVSFVYNCGTGAISTKTGVGRALRAQQWSVAADCLLQWNKAGGRPVAGLTRRRTAERALFLDTDDPDPLEGYTDNERAWIREYDHLRRQHANPKRQDELRALMLAQRKRIWHVARPQEKGGDGQGWDHGARRERYASLLCRTH